MLALISVSSYIAIPLPFSDAKITAQTMIVNLIGLLIAPQDTIFSYGELAAVRLMRRAGIQRRKPGTGKTAWTERRLLYRISGCSVPDFPVLPEMEKCCIQTAFLIVVGIPVIYAFGAGWMKHVTGQPWGAVIVQSIIPFIPLDIVKCVAAVALGKALKRTGLFGN